MTSRVFIPLSKAMDIPQVHCVGQREAGHLKPQHFVQQSAGKATSCASLLSAKSRIPLG